MEKITEILSPTRKISYTSKHLKLLLNIDKVKYNIPLDCLFNIALRQNKKRAFLFVSKVLGKHLPIDPKVLKIIGGILARLLIENSEDFSSHDIEILVNALMELQYKSEKNVNSSYKYVNKALIIIEKPIKLQQNTLFIGFAETATGIAQSVFNNFTNASYIHTTRVELSSLKPNFIFKEEHSHAVNHSIYTLDDYFFKSFEKIILVDDELTTGNTCINLMKNLPGETFGILTILDWRNTEQLKVFNSLKNIRVTVTSLVKGTIDNIETLDNFDDDITNIDINNNNILHRDITFKVKTLIEGYHSFTGRFGISSNLNTSIKKQVKLVAKLIKKNRIDGNCLCLGTEEFIYIPCMISAELGDNVYFHSTTKSPIYAKNEEEYCIKSKVKFSSPFDNNVQNYLYNLPTDFYKQVILYTEKPLEDDKKTMFKDIFNTFNIKEILFVCWN
jgi:hypothetical protein